MLPGVIPGFNLACRSRGRAGRRARCSRRRSIRRSCARPTTAGSRATEAPLGREAPTGATPSTSTPSRAAIRERHAPVPPVQSAQPGRPRVHARRSCAHRRDLPRARPRDRAPTRSTATSSSPATSTCRSPRSAPRSSARTITLMAPSKTFNLAGLKCSIAIIPERRAAGEVRGGRSSTSCRAVNILGYTATLAAYRDGQPWLDELLRYLEANRDFLAAVRADQPARRLDGHARGRPISRGSTAAARGMPGDDPFTFFLERAKVALQRRRGVRRAGPRASSRLNFGCPRALLTRGAGADAARARQPVARTIRANLTRAARPTAADRGRRRR